MKKSFLATLLSVSAAISGGSAYGANNFDDSQIKHIEYPDWFSGNLFHDLSEDLENARSHGKQGLMVLFTTEGCSYCYLFVQKSLGDPNLASRVQRQFESVGLEIFDDREMTDPRGSDMPIKQFAQREGAEFAPTLLFYDLDGNRILKLVGYQSPERFGHVLDYIDGGHFRTEPLRDYFAKLSETGGKPSARTVPGLRTDTLFSKPPYRLVRGASAENPPLIVIFERASCSECEEFHDKVLAQPDVRETLSRFQVVQLDADDDKTAVTTPGGGFVTPASWFHQEGFSRVPALMFFDEDGVLALTTDALVLEQRMMNSLNFVLTGAHEKGWTYQRFARSQAIARWQRQQEEKNK
jgi:thioredoxin-related protein